MSKERPILFSAPMVRALLSGAKTQTRRLVKHPNVMDVDAWADAGGGLWEMGVHEAGSTAGMGKLRCPYGAPGDRLWVRETWGILTGNGIRTVYRADDEQPVPNMKWAPSIHMRRHRSRIDLEVTAVRVERLQDISPEDAMAEGVRCDCMHPVPMCKGNIDAFRDLWESINGAESWASNPWVWVISFTKVRP